MSQNGTILVVDDAPSALKLMASLLVAEGYAVRPADSGEMALAAIDAALPELILLDVRMAGMDGYEVCRRLKAQERTRHIPIIFVSAVADAEDRAKGLKLGAVDYISKPLQPAELLARVRTQLTLSRAAAALERQAQELRQTNERMKQEIDLRAQAEQVLRKSEERYREFYERSPLGYQSLDADGRFIIVNQAWLEILGYTSDEVKGKWFGDFLAPEFVAVFRERFPLFKAAGTIHSEFWMIRKDGSRCYVGFDGRIGHHADGQFKQTHCILHDMTERKLAADALFNEQERLRVTVQSVGDAVIATNRAGKVTVLNTVAEQLTGWSRRDAMGRDVNEIFHIINELTGEPAVNPVMTVLACGTMQGLANHTALIARDGTRRSIADSGAPIRDGEDNIIGVVLIFRDVTDERKAEDALRESEQRYRTLANAGQALVWTSGLDKGCNYFNEPWLLFTGRTLEQELGNGWTEGVHPEDFDRCLKTYVTAFDRRERFSMEYRLRHASGEYRWLQDDGTPRFDGRGNFLGYIGHCLDITERKRDQEALQAAKLAAETATAAKDQFIAMLSHELRTPLTPALMAVSAMLEMRTDLPPEVRKDLAGMQQNIEREARLIDDLLDLTRLARGKIHLHFEVVDVHACLRSAMEVCQADVDAKHAEVLLFLDAGNRMVWADPDRLRQVFWNLFRNAMKFMPMQGKITIRSRSSGGRLYIEITDNGIGIAREVLPRLFQPFEQADQSRSRKYGGLGLGLAIAGTIATLHKGSISASSPGVNQGATFTVELPTIDAMPERHLPEAAPLPADPSARRLLVVEDDVDTLRLLTRLLRSWGYVVVPADGVRAALKAAESEKFDLLVSDIGLPDGSGTDVMRAVKERYGLRGIAVSGYGTDDDKQSSLDAGFEQHLTKPLDFRTLASAIKTSVQRH